MSFIPNAQVKFARRSPTFLITTEHVFVGLFFVIFVNFVDSLFAKKAKKMLESLISPDPFASMLTFSRSST